MIEIATGDLGEKVKASSSVNSAPYVAPYTPPCMSLQINIISVYAYIQDVVKAKLHFKCSILTLVLNTGVSVYIDLKVVSNDS